MTDMENKQKHKSYRFVWLLLLLPLALLMQQLCKSNPQLTESIYSRHIYPVISAAISPIFGILPFSAAEVIIVVLVILLLRAVIKGIMELFVTGPVVILRGLLKLAVILCTGYFLFTVMWGLNYYRLPLATDLKLKTGKPNVTELSAVMSREISAINALSPSINFDKSGHSFYNGGFDSMRSQVNEGYGWLAAPQTPKDRIINRVYAWPKGIFPSNLMSYTGIEGIFVPFTYEPSIDTDYPQFILPFTISHETAHFKGFAREDEANYLAFLACLGNPDIYYQYSGHMNAFLYLSDALYSTDSSLWKQDVSQLDKRAAADIDFYYDYVKNHQSKAADVASKVNDDYLKSQGQPGIVSYDNFVNLLCDQYRTDVR